MLGYATAASAAAPYYGGGMTAAADAARTPTVPVMAHFGDQDHWIPLDTVEVFKKAQPGVTVHVYAANHGFNPDQRGSYNEAAAKLARERTLAFFAQHIGCSPTTPRASWTTSATSSSTRTGGWGSSR